MSFLDRAKQAANQAAEAAKHAATEAQAAAQRTSDKLSDPATAEKARQALSRAKKGISTAIDRIDPSVLADVVIKATALQEKANAALKAPGVKESLNKLGIEAAGGGPQILAGRVKNEMQKWIAIVRDKNIRVEP